MMDAAPFRGWMAAAAVLIIAATAMAQEVALEIGPRDVGLAGRAGHVRPGMWTPLRVGLTNRTTSARALIVQWLLTDIDGDTVVAEQPVTLAGGEAQPQQWRWMYAQPSVNLDARTRWEILVLDADTRRVIDQKTILGQDYTILPAQINLIGVLGATGLGLQPYQRRFTQHEEIRFIEMPGLAHLPDRWYGLSATQALIWTRDGGDPQSMSPASQDALRQWVRRGGHLVIVMPYAIDPWSSSPLGDLLPNVNITSHREQTLPLFLGRSGDMESVRIDYRSLEPRDAATAVLLRHNAGDGPPRPLVVARTYGFGRVTLIGVDLTDARLRARNLPNGAALWRAVFGWRSPAFADWQIQEQIEPRFEPRMMGPDSRRDVYLLGRQIEGAIAMRETATPALMAAIVLFVLYWLAAGPVGFAYLKQRGMARHSWLGFTAVVGAMTVIAWGGAWMIRPNRTMLKHFTVVDVDTRDETVRAHSWAALFVPRHGTVQVTMDPESDESAAHVLGSAGILPGTGAGGYLDPQRYVTAAADPGEMLLPFRSTARQLEMQYQGQWPDYSRWVEGDWLWPRGANEGLRVRQVGERTIVSGELVHGLNDALTEVLLVYCPGNGAEPLVYRHDRAWQPGTTLALGPQIQWGRLAIDAHPMIQPRTLDREGYLGTMMARMANLRSEQDPGNVELVELSGERVVQEVEMLTFYSTLPPPDYRNTSLLGSHSYVRPTGRSLDLSSWLSMRQLIVIGHLPRAPLPVPLSVDGRVAPSEGWVVVRAICDVRE